MLFKLYTCMGVMYALVYLNTEKIYLKLIKVVTDIRSGDEDCRDRDPKKASLAYIL